MSCSLLNWIAHRNRMEAMWAEIWKYDDETFQKLKNIKILHQQIFGFVEMIIEMEKENRQCDF